MKKIVTFVVLYGLSFVVHANSLVVGHYVDDPTAKSACQSHRVEVGGNWCSEYPTLLGDGLYQYSHPGATVDPIDYYYFQFHQSGVCPDGTEPDPNDGECVEPQEPDPCDESSALGAYPDYSDFFTYSRAGGAVTANLGTEYFFVCSSNCLVRRDFNFSLSSETIDTVVVEETHNASIESQSCENPPESESDLEPTVFPGSTSSSDSDGAADTDGDGNPNDADDDIDGDGVPNSQDPDADGDGIPNEDDGAAWGEDEGTGESASHSDSCSVRPACDGNPIQCAQLMELWRNRCALEDAPDLGDPGVGIEGLDPDSVEAAIQSATDEYTSTINQIKSEAESLLSLTVAGGGSIQPNVLDIRGVSIDFSFFKWLEYLTIIGYIILAVCVIRAVFIIFGD